LPIRQYTELLNSAHTGRFVVERARAGKGAERPVFAGARCTCRGLYTLEFGNRKGWNLPQNPLRNSPPGPSKTRRTFASICCNGCATTSMARSTSSWDPCCSGTSSVCFQVKFIVIITCGIAYWHLPMIMGLFRIFMLLAY
jgi:hypothetical protein